MHHIEIKIVMEWNQCNLRHTAVGSSDNPVLVDEGTTTEMEASCVLVWKVKHYW